MRRDERLRSARLEECLEAMAELARGEPPNLPELEALAACLGDARKAVQRPAAELFATLAAQGVVVGPHLEAALRAPIAGQRWGAAYAFSLLGETPEAALPVLLETLGSADGDTRWAAAHIVVGLGPRSGVTDRLLELIATGNPAQRKMALYCLRDIGLRSPAGLQAALGALGDADPGVRLAAVSSLARVATDRERAAGALVATLEGADAPLRRAAAAALGAIGSRADGVLAALRRAAADADASLRRAAERSLRLLGAQP